MSQEQQDQIVGRIVREKRETEQKVTQLTAEASRIGNILIDLGSHLTRYPESVQFEGVPTNAKYLRSASPIFKAEEIDGRKIAALTNEIRNATESFERLQAQAGKFGV